MQLNVILADDLLPLKNHRALAVPQLSRCFINLQVKCICSESHPPRCRLCWYDPGYSVWAGQENGSLKKVRGWESMPATTYKEPSIASVTVTYTVFLQDAYQLRCVKYSHSSSTCLLETQQMIHLCHCHAVISVPQQAYFGSSAK